MNKKILIVEGDPARAEQVQALLAGQEGAAFDARVAGQLGAALAQLSRTGFDAVLLNLDLPDSGGVSTLQRLRLAAPDVPLIVLGKLDDEALALQVIEAGAQDYIVWAQLNRPMLARILRYAIERQRLKAELRAQVAEAQRELAERKLMEENMRASEERFRLLTAVSPVGICLTDTDGSCQYVNPRWCEIAGLSVDEALGGGWLNWVHPADRPRLAALWQKLEDGDGPQTLDYRFESAAGQVTWVHATLARRLDPLGRLLGYIGANVDITERKQAEDALRESEAKFRSMVDKTGDLIAMTDAAGVITYASPASQPLFGCAPEEMCGRNFTEFLDASSIPQALAAFRKSQEFGAGSRELELLMKRRDGSTFVGELTGSDFRWGAYLGSLVVIRDITERKRAEATLAESKALMQTIVDSTSDLIWSVDAGRLGLLTWNRAFQEYFRLHRGIAVEVGQRPEELFPAGSDYIPLWRQFYARALTEGPYTTEYLVYAGSRTLQLNLNLLQKDGQTFGISVFGRDITERKQAEEALEESEQKYRSLFENASIGIFHSLPEGRFLRVNPTLAAMLGYASPEEMVALVTNINTQIYVDSKRRAEIYAALKPGIWSYAENRYRRKDGSLLTANLAVRRVHHSDGTLAYLEGLVEDITEQKRAEEALRQLNATLEQRVADRTAQLDAANQELNAINLDQHNLNLQLTHALQARDEFLASMSHELRTPLTSILGLAEALQMEIYGALTEKQRHALRTLHDSGQHLLSLITDILDLSKTAAGKLELRRTSVSVDDVCQASLRLIQGQVNQKQLKLALDMDAAVAVIQADERRLKQILVNLLGNAVKFTPSGGRVGLEVAGDAGQGVARFTVWDTGLGIAPDVMPRLFKPFVQLDDRLNREHSGTGLGLALVHQLVALHGGSITLASEGMPGRGCRFTVSLPWSPKEGQDPAPYLQPGPAEGSDQVSRQRAGEGKPILLADDNPSLLTWLSEALLARGYRVHTATNGLEALAQARAIRPALMVLDVQMPGLDGLEVMRQLRRDPAFAATPIIALTALAMPGDRERCLEAGATDYFTKPVSLNALFQRLEAQL